MQGYTIDPNILFLYASGRHVTSVQLEGRAGSTVCDAFRDACGTVTRVFSSEREFVAEIGTH